MENKLVLIDGNSVLYRSFYALPLLALPDGRYTNAIYGFANTIIKTINEHKPTHIAVAFDVAKRTFRNDIYADYKATRKPMPEELRSQIEPVKKMLELMGIKILEKEGLEADDILGTISKRFENTQTYIITGDRDTLQLISPTTTIYFTKKGLTDIKVMDMQGLYEEYGIKPDSVVDLKALQGDTADNIPGVPGIGVKTASELIQEYETIENVYNNLDKLKTAVKNKLENGKEFAEMSYKLAKINCNVDIPCELEELKYDFPFNMGVLNFMRECRFNSIVKKDDLFKIENIAIDNEEYKIENLDSLDKVRSMVINIEKNGVFSMFIDDKGNYHFASEGTEWILKATSDLFSTQISDEELFLNTKQIFENVSIRKIFFDSKSLRHKLRKFGVNIEGKFEDVGIMAHLVEGISIKTIEDALGMSEICNKAPAVGLLLAFEKFLNNLKEMVMDELYYEVELPLSVVLFEMEFAGFKVDTNRVDELGKIYKSEIDRLVSKIYDLAGEVFNINSSKQLGEILFDKLGLPHNKKKSTNAELLEEIINSHEIVPVILRYRKLSKLYSTYIEGLRPHIDENNFVHTSFKQTLTNTGRLSSVEPNLQNIPIRSEESREVRSIYIASSEDHVLIDADYSQIELRLLAHFSKDPIFVQAFNEGKDIHAQTACQAFGVNIENITPEMRRVAKIVNFGIIYGISDFGLANDLKTTPKEARVFIDSFYKNHPAVRDYMDDAIKIARETGRVSTILGRTRKMVDINSSNYMIRMRAERACQNMPLQGSAADIIKLAMIKVRNALKEGNYKAKLIMQVHDELLIDCPIEEKEAVSNIIRESMNTAYELRVPLVCDVVSSYRWSDGH